MAKHFTPGEKVEALDPITHEWRTGVVMEDAPYRGRGGAYVYWEPLGKLPSYVSAGGWQPENCIRAREAA